MPRKSKTNKRLDKLFEDIKPEENVSGTKDKPEVPKEAAAPPSDSKAGPAPEVKPAPRKTPAKFYTGALIAPEILPPPPGDDYQGYAPKQDEPLEHLAAPFRALGYQGKRVYFLRRRKVRAPRPAAASARRA